MKRWISVKISICIPTFNREKHLRDCINSLIICKQQTDVHFQICISDNGSTDETGEVIKSAQSKIEIKYNKNSHNLGITQNFLKVVSMADGDFIWLIGDDDLVLPHAINRLYELINKNREVDFFYVNSFHLETDYLENYPRPFDTKYLPEEMEPFSKWDRDGELDFFELIDPRISFDFLGGVFLAVFRKEKWEQHTQVLDQDAINDMRTFSHFDNTFPHLKIFSRAFAGSRAYFNSEPLNVCLTGAREWSHMSPLVTSVRLLEALHEYRKNGLSFWRYVYCKNYALRNFIPDLINMIINRNISGFYSFNLLELILKNFLFPNFYLSFFYFFGRRLSRLMRYLIIKFT